MKEVILELFAILVVYSYAQVKYKKENPVLLTAEQRAKEPQRGKEYAAWSF